MGDGRLTRRLRVALIAIGLALGVGTQAFAVEPEAKLAPGAGSLVFPFVSGGEARRITLWYFRPAAAGTDAPIVFVMHGAGRSGESYRKAWIPFAEKGGYVLLVPEFSRKEFPGNTYEQGNMIGRDGARHPESQWTYTAVEDIFDAVRAANGFTAPTYDIYGHSAGGQFLHRLVFFKPDARYRVAVAASSGWYLMPDFKVEYPYGLAGSGVGRDQVARAFGRRVVVLLGGDDTDPNHYQLRRTREAMRQGTNRLERGQAYYERARRAAAELQTPFNWLLEVAPGVAHSNAQMAPFAAKYVGRKEN